MIKTIIFDLGGVLMDLNFQAVTDAFLSFGGKSIDLFHELYHEPLFEKFETGKLSAAEFRPRLSKLLNLQAISAKQFDAAWNSLLTKPHIETIEFLKSLHRQGYHLFLLSNTNEIHIRELNFLCHRDLNITNFFAFFDRVYLSYLLGERKPSPAVFERVLLENELDPSETIFLDDSWQNIQGAKSVHIHTLHYSSALSWEQVRIEISNL